MSLLTKIVTPPNKRTSKGREAENLVAHALELEGWIVLARNWRKWPGEIDIIALKDRILSFVEVKVTDAFGIESLETLIDLDKRKRIIETSKLFITMHREFNCKVIRYDVVSVSNGMITDYYENAFAE